MKIELEADQVEAWTIDGGKRARVRIVNPRLDLADLFPLIFSAFIWVMVPAFIVAKVLLR